MFGLNIGINIFAVVTLVLINIHSSNVSTVHPDAPKTLRILVQNQHGYRKYRQIFPVIEVDQYGRRRRQLVSAEPLGVEDFDCQKNPSNCFIRKIQIREGRVIDDDYDAVDALDFGYDQWLDYMDLDGGQADIGNAGWGWNDEPYSHPYHYPALHRPTGNIYYPGNKYYSGSHANIKLFKKDAKKSGKGKKKTKPKKYKKSKYHLGPIVHFSPYDDDDDDDYGWSRTLPLPHYQRYYN